MSLKSCKWVQPFPRARERLAPLRHNMASAGNGQRGRARRAPTENPGRAVRGRDLYRRSVRSVGADVHGAQAHAAAGFDPALLQAAVETGVDIDAAYADADSGTPAIAQTVAPVMAVVKSAGGSGRCSGNGERGGGDQSEGHLAKHRKYSPIDWHEALLRPCPSVGPTTSCVDAHREESRFRNVSWRAIGEHPFDPDNH